MSISPSGHVSHERKARDSNPHPRTGNRVSSAARPTVSGYLPFFSGPTGNRTRISSLPSWRRPVGPSARIRQWTAGESNPDLLVASQASSRWTSSPLSPEVRPGIEPGLPPYRGGVLPEHLQTISQVIPDGVEPSLSWLSPRRRCRWTTGSFVSDRGGSRTHRVTRLSTSPLCQFAYPAVSCRSGSRTRRSRLMRPGEPAHPQLQAPVSSRATGLMRASRAPAAPATSQ